MNLTIFAILYVLALSASVYLGYRIARKKYFLQKRQWKPSGIENSIISLFALILSFTLLLSGNASKDRRELLDEHVDVLSALYRDAGFAPAPIRDTTQAFVLRILKEKAFEDQANAFEEDTLAQQSNILYKNFWRTLVNMQERNVGFNHDITPLMAHVNKATALHYKIEYGVSDQTPAIMISMIILCSLLIGMVVGFVNGFNENDHLIVPIVFILMTSVTVMVIQDINDLRRGFFRPSLNNYTNAYNEFIKD